MKAMSFRRFCSQSMKLVASSLWVEVEGHCLPKRGVCAGVHQQILIFFTLTRTFILDNSDARNSGFIEIYSFFFCV